MNRHFWNRRSFLKASLVGAFLLFSKSAYPYEAITERFVEGRLSLYNTHTEERLDVLYRDTEGEVDANNLIVGSWKPGNIESWVVAPGDIGSLTFYPNGTYIEWEDTDTNCSSSPTGVEYGTYTYDANSKTLTATSMVDENGDCGGLTSFAGQTNSIGGISVVGDVLTSEHEDGKTDTFNRVK